MSTLNARSYKKKTNTNATLNALKKIVREKKEKKYYVKINKI